MSLTKLLNGSTIDGSNQVLPEPTFSAFPIAVDPTPTIDQPKRGRGRPPGSTNKPNPLDALQAWIEETARSGVNEERVREIVKESIGSIAPSKIEIVTPTATTTLEGLVHFQFELVLKAMTSGVNIALTGSTATGKTTMPIQIAKALGKEYMLFKPMYSPSQAEGYNSATGEFIMSNLYRAHKAGMVAIWDEFDASDPNILLVINSILDNKTYTYPNGETVTNENFQLIATMNTRGTGASRSFVGRNRLDAATLDRFAVLEIERDLSLEAALIGVTESKKDPKITLGGSATADAWLHIVRRKRSKLERTHPDKIVSTRAVRDGWKLLQAGIGLDHVINMTINK